ncbi:hypothetical protein LNQ49_19140 [Flavobacterium sp. F-65]|uniref:Uncharacterized protein n=1 Tax=Flavobacterium pisciphilum TaxID=2893755 RepID=A0ABS8MY46_9FLAO|nr:hypothetical protein [Flavobacterium sp. F-65]MCC9073699.1 hypothetical protein [Flavobacterium sp. F-65]
MSLYTISPDFLSSINKDEQAYLSNILFVFSNKNNTFKVTKDRNSDIISIYQAIQQNADIIKTWLECMSFSPNTFEKIDVDISNIACMETKFIKVCKETKANNNLIVYSTQNISKFNCLDKIIDYEGVNIKIFDRDDANLELNQNINNVYITNSQVATNGSKIIKSKNG